MAIPCESEEWLCEEKWNIFIVLLIYPLSLKTRKLTTKKKVLAIEEILLKDPSVSYEIIDAKFLIPEKDFRKIKKGVHKHSSEACRD